MLMSFMDHSDYNLKNSIKNHSSMFSSEIIFITLINGIHIGKGSKNDKTNPVKFELRVFVSTTIWELKQIVAENIGIKPTNVFFER